MKRQSRCISGRGKSVKKTLGATHQEVSNSLHDLALLYKAEGDYPEAEFMFKRALSIKEKVLGPHHIEMAIALNNLAVLYDSWRRFQDSETCYKRAIEITELNLGIIAGEGLTAAWKKFRFDTLTVRKATSKPASASSSDAVL